MVPFFISDGLHSYEDIPVMLGAPERVVRERLQQGQPTWRNPTERDGKSEPHLVHRQHRQRTAPGARRHPGARPRSGAAPDADWGQFHVRNGGGGALGGAPGPPNVEMTRASLDWISARRAGSASNSSAAPAMFWPRSPDAG
jgi:hypothetical protein